MLRRFVRAKAKLLVKEIEKAAYIETSGGHGKAAAIGALLPMKGAYARFGDDALKGILLAANVFGASPERWQRGYLKGCRRGRARSD